MRAEDPYLRLQRKTRITETGCWEWTGAYMGTNQYGALKVYGRMVGVHRFSAQLFLGLHENDVRHVLHHCDNPRCWRPEHLYIGTHQDNMRDMQVRGRQVKGETHGRAKLSQDDVDTIRAEIKCGVPNKDLAERYGVSSSMISSIRHYRYWSN